MGDLIFMNMSLSKSLEKAETHFFIMFIKSSAIDSDRKNKEADKFQAQTNCKSKKWSSFLRVLALASVMKRKFFPISLIVYIKCKGS